MSENGGECQIRFVTSDYPTIAKESISVPLSCTAAQLKSLVEGLLQEKLGISVLYSSNLGTIKIKYYYESPACTDRADRA